MHRLLVATDSLESASPTLSSEAARHLRVVRPKDGEEIELFDGKGHWRVCAYRAEENRLLPVSPVQFAKRPEKALTLFACVTKGSRWDWTIEKATELGVTRIVPVISERTIVRIPRQERAAKLARWRRIAEDAARQSDAKWLPEICEPVDFADSLPLVKETSCLIGALTVPPPPAISCAEGDAVYVGPEGDFTPDELAALCEVAKPVTFGPTILRAETAAIFAVSVLKARQT